jgi:hypothetical protein
MNAKMRAEIRALAERCVDRMGDIFWDRDAYPETGAEYPQPLLMARDCVEATIVEFAERHALASPSARRRRRL